MALYGEKLKSICEKVGVDPSTLKDGLFSTLLDAIEENAGGGANNQDKIITENGVYTADEGYTGLGTVNVVVSGADFDALIERTLTDVSSGVASIGADAFSRYGKLKSVNFPNAVTVGNMAFSNSGIISAHIPNATTLGSKAFQWCSGLKSANFPNILTVSNSAFDGCSSLTDVNIPKATTIQNSAFSSCIYLEYIDLPSVTSIGSSAFQYCYRLKSVVLRSETVCSLSSTNVFSGCYHILGTVNSTYNPTGAKDGYIYVPSALVESHQSATNWSTYSTQFRALEDYTVDGTITGALDLTKI